MANTIEVEITAQDSASQIIDKTNTNLDKMAQELVDVQAGLQNLDWSRAFKDASRIDVATAALDDLKKKLDNGAISFDDYQSAIQKTQRAFDMVTPESEQLAQKVTQLNQDFAEGKVDADQYAKELDDLTREMDELGNEAQDTSKKAQETAKGFGLMDGAMMSLGSKAADFTAG